MSWIISHTVKILSIIISFSSEKKKLSKARRPSNKRKDFFFSTYYQLGWLGNSKSILNQLGLQ